MNNPQVVKFCNEILRPTADITVQSFDAIANLYREWAVGEYATTIPDDDTVIEDGAAEDGRKVLTGAKVHAMMTRVGLLIQQAQEEGTGISAFVAVAVNTRR
jgi:hypothetical protein